MLTPEENAMLTSIGPGTPGGEYMRRFWHPIALSDELKDFPRRVRLLGEDLVLFRDGKGRLGLLGLQCSHRLASLEFGSIQEEGIRCRYHGWLYNNEGRCLHQPAEPKDSTFRDRIKHLSYQVKELAGLVFAYMGEGNPPPIPCYDTMVREDGFRYVFRLYTWPANYLSVLENGACDGWHVPFVHGPLVDRYEYREDAEWHWWRETEHGVASLATIKAPRFGPMKGERTIFTHLYSWIIPHLSKTSLRPLKSMDTEEYVWPSADLLIWHTPIDDYNTLGIECGFVSGEHHDKEKLMRYIHAVSAPEAYRNSWPPKRDEDGRYQLREYPEQDAAMIMGQGAISPRDREHLGSSDRGVILVRKALLDGIEAVKMGRDPKGLIKHNEIIEVPSRNEWVSLGGNGDMNNAINEFGTSWVNTGRLDLKV